MTGDKDFLYFITDDQGRSYTEDANGNIVVRSIPDPLEDTPEGWQDKSIRYARSQTRFGLFRTFTIPLGFVRTGAKIVRHLYYNFGIQAVGNLIIQWLNRLTNVYQGYYIGALDFSRFSDGENVAEINVMEGGLSELLKANENTTYEIPVNVPEAVDVVMDGVELQSVVSVISYPDTIIEAGGQEVPNVRFSAYTNVGCTIVNSETKYPSLYFNDFTAYWDGNGLPPPADEWLLQANNDATVSISGRLKFFLASTAYRVIAYLQKGSFSREIELAAETFPTGQQRDIDADITSTFTIQEGERMWLVVWMDTSGDGESISFNQENSFSLTYNYRHPATTVKCLRPLYVLNELLKKITNGKYGAISSLLSGEALDFVLTCGDAIRGFDTAVLKTSFNDFFLSYNTRFNIGVGISMEGEQALILEKKKYFLNDNNLVDLGEVADLVVTPAEDHQYNTVKIGWPDQDYEDVNGRNEFNTTQGYTTPITRVQKELDLTSAYRADCYGIEFTRINLEGKTTTDSDSDNDVFMVNIAPDGAEGYILNRPAYDSITGVLSPNTIFNVELSPKRCLLAHANYLHAMLDKLDAGYLTYQTTDKNGNLSTTLNGVTVTEKANVQIATLGPKLFLPQLFEFNTEVPLNIVELIETDPYARVKFWWLGNPYYGYINEASQQPDMNPKQTFKLLAAPNNDLKTLIRA